MPAPNGTASTSTATSRPWKRPPSIRAQVQPIPPLLARLGEKPSSSRGADQVAYASRALIARIQPALGGKSGSDDENSLGVAVTWPRERRLARGLGGKDKGKGKEESLVVWVRELPEEAAHLSVDADCLYVPPQLLPAFSTPPLPVRIQRHEPIPLSSIVLQLVLDDESVVVSPNDIDLDRVLQHITASPTPDILREGHVLRLPAGETLRVVMLEPTRQGVPTPNTQLILSSTPYSLPLDDDVEYLDDDAASSHARTHISMHDFDPDAFLSGSLSLQARTYSDDDVRSRPEPDWASTNGHGYGSGHSTETSGSTTPRAFRPVSPAVPVEEVLLDGDAEEPDSGTRFTAVPSGGPVGAAEVDACWVGVGGLGRAGIFEGDWVILRPTSSGSSSAVAPTGRLVRVLAWEQLDESSDDLPAAPILVPPTIFRSLSAESAATLEIVLAPTPFGARTPTLPTAKSISIARIATTEGVDKRYERAWLHALRGVFRAGKHDAGEHGRLVRRGDIFSVPVFRDRPITAEDELSDSEPEQDDSPRPIKAKQATGLAYFIVTALSFDALVPIEDDFGSSASAKARAGELGCWVEGDGGTRMVLVGMERARVGQREWDREWHDLDPMPLTALGAASKLRDLLGSALSPAFASAVQLSVLLKGARGSGKRTLIRRLADELGYNVVEVDCFDAVGDTLQVTQGTIQARLEKAKTAAPAIVLLHHIEALAKKSDASATGRQPPVVKVLEDALAFLRDAGKETGWSCVLLGTTCDAEAVPGAVLGCFKQEVELGAPNEVERRVISAHAARGYHIAPDISLSGLATQTAALQAGDIRSLLLQAHDLALRRATKAAQRQPLAILQAGLSITSADLTSALSLARSAYSDSIGAPKIPNVSWDDIGGLASVKSEILETIQLPLEHPELFASGIKKRSGILLYGPPGTGKTLLAKAVATSCSLNFFSVKGPELLNMYIGESEANVRRVFQRARDASPCVVFMDELDSVAPKRGNQGDSGGVMDRIVSQLLAELDGMGSSSSGGGAAPPQVYVMGATNRPDLLDPALLRPGRFDRLVYLSPPRAHREQADILRALTRKFDLEDGLDMDDVAQGCGFNLTGADLYALASDAMLCAMGRVAGEVDGRIARLEVERAAYQGEGASAVRSGANGNGNGTGDGNGIGSNGHGPNGDTRVNGHGGGQPEALGLDGPAQGFGANANAGWKVAPSDWPTPLTPQFYLSALADEDEMRVRVGKADFDEALARLRPSVSVQEMEHYERVQRGFRGGKGE